MNSYLLVFIGGGFGSILRFVISNTVAKLALKLPFGTLICNVVSCVVLGLLLWSYQQKNVVPSNYKHLIIIGICGGLSTFSTFSLETIELYKQGFTIWAFANIIFNCLLCFGVFYFALK